MGYALADAACNQGANVTLISGPVHLKNHPEAELIKITTANEMMQAFENINLKKIDYIFMCAAVSDYTPKNINSKKINREKDNLKIECESAPDIIKTIAKKTDAIIIAFALETENGEKNAQKKF